MANFNESLNRMKDYIREDRCKADLEAQVRLHKGKVGTAKVNLKAASNALNEAAGVMQIQARVAEFNAAFKVVKKARKRRNRAEKSLLQVRERIGEIRANLMARDFIKVNSLEKLRFLRLFRLEGWVGSCVIYRHHPAFDDLINRAHRYNIPVLIE